MIRTGPCRLSRWSGALQDRIGSRWPLVAGPIVTAVGCALLARTDAGGSYWIDFLPPMLAVGLGIGIIVSPLTASVLNAVSRSRSGLASGINNSVEEVSSLLAVALFGTIALLLFQQGLANHLLPIADGRECRLFRTRVGSYPAVALADGCDTSAASRKTRCTNCTTVDPSPTAAASRLVLPERASPAAKMLGSR